MSHTSASWIPVSNPKANYLAHKEEIDDAVARVMNSGRYLFGPEVEAFEEEFAEYLGVEHVIAVGSGTDALLVSLMALGIEQGDKVVVPALTASATAMAPKLLGAELVITDVYEEDGTIDSGEVHTAKCAAMIPVHLYGLPCEMNHIYMPEDHIIEDCCQAAGAKWGGSHVGTLGRAGAFSFFPTKNLSCFGDAGAISTNDGEVDWACRGIRQYGWSIQRNDSDYPGYNSRMSELQAAVLRVKLPYLDKENAQRRVLAERYQDGLDGLPTGTFATPEECEHVYHQFVILVPSSLSRSKLILDLACNGIEGAVHYPRPIHRQPAFFNRETLVIAEKLCQSVLSLPMYPELTFEQQDHVIETVRKFFDSGNGS
tara:strand:- start:6712 stop:7824 length:1113 start_codon:yes stop_codon:yes gene_type:complete